MHFFSFLTALPASPMKQSLFCFLPACEVSAAPHVGARLCALLKCLRWSEGKEQDASEEKKSQPQFIKKAVWIRHLSEPLIQKLVELLVSTGNKQHLSKQRKGLTIISQRNYIYCIFCADFSLICGVFPLLIPCFSLSVVFSSQLRFGDNRTNRFRVPSAVAAAITDYGITGHWHLILRNWWGAEESYIYFHTILLLSS